KGRGRLLMISDFIVQYPSGSFFALNDDEWKLAVEEYTQLAHDDAINYLPQSTSASINLGVERYFDNDTTLMQFERLF
ncbi:unnamed protein product, partial [Rotaria sp. Silwood1]